MKGDNQHGGINALSIFETAVASLRDAFLEVFDENRLLRARSSRSSDEPVKGKSEEPAGETYVEDPRACEGDDRGVTPKPDPEGGDDLLTSLYVASFSLHRTRDFELVMSSIKEILINLIGAEKFQLFLADRDQHGLILVDDQTNDGPSARRVSLTEGIAGVVAKTGIAYFETESRTGDFYNPLACVPLSVDGRVIGLILVTDLFVQKPCLTNRDSELFSLLAEHAGPAILSSLLWRQYKESAEFGLPEGLLPDLNLKNTPNALPEELVDLPSSTAMGEDVCARRLS